MQTANPHYILFSESCGSGGPAASWRFVLQPVGGDACLTAEAAEPESRNSRLELLAVVRGLEALDSPSRVTLLTKSRYVSRGISRGLGAWRERHWRWERFGQLVPIRDHDLWRRVDHAMRFHRIDCCGWSGSEFPSSSPSQTVSGAAPVVQAADPPALLIVPRVVGRRPTIHSPLVESLDRLRRGILSGLSALWPPAFTRAA